MLKSALLCYVSDTYQTGQFRLFSKRVSNVVVSMLSLVHISLDCLEVQFPSQANYVLYHVLHTMEYIPLCSYDTWVAEI